MTTENYKEVLERVNLVMSFVSSNIGEITDLFSKEYKKKRYLLSERTGSDFYSIVCTRWKQPGQKPPLCREISCPEKRHKKDVSHGCSKCKSFRLETNTSFSKKENHIRVEEIALSDFGWNFSGIKNVFGLDFCAYEHPKHKNHYILLPEDSVLWIHFQTLLPPIVAKGFGLSSLVVHLEIWSSFSEDLKKVTNSIIGDYMRLEWRKRGNSENTTSVKDKATALVKEYMGENFRNIWLEKVSSLEEKHFAQKTLEMVTKSENDSLRLCFLDFYSYPEMLTALSNDKKALIRSAVAKNLKTPRDVLEKLSKDKSDEVRSAVASNIVPDILRELSEDKSLSVRTALAKNPETPPDVLEKLSKDKKVLYHVLENPNTPPQVLEKVLEKDDSKRVKSLVAGNSNTPVELLKELSKSKLVDIRIKTASNSRTPVEDLVRLSKDKNFFVRRAVASNPSTPPEVLQELSKDSKWQVRSQVARNQNTPTEALVALAKDKYAKVRLTVILNPSCSPFLVNLAKSYHFDTFQEER